MIRAKRGLPLDGFAERAADWKTRFEVERSRNPDLTVSSFWAGIRSSIRSDAMHLYKAFHGKCAFCESRMAHVSNPQVEHYRPKSKYPDAAFDWENWLLSCGRCNDRKWAHFPDCDGVPCLVDPAAEDPELHIEFIGYVPVPKTRRGTETIQLIGLDRSPLEDERSRWLSYINGLLLLCISSANAEFRREARELLIWSMQDDAPYAAMVRCYLRARTPRLANPPQSHLPVRLDDPIGRIQQLVDILFPVLQEIE
jgi:uncharacterized protein (TIGR02646 family)